MRIALVLEPPATPVKASTWLLDVLQDRSFSLVMLPADTPLERALGASLATESAGASDVLVLARAAGGVVAKRDWDALGLAARVRALEPADELDAEAAIAEAAAHFDHGDLERAHRAYSTADALLARDDGPRRAEVLVCLADIEASRDSLAAAGKLLDRALAIFPNHQTALRKRIDLARASHDAATAAALRKRLLPSAETDEERAALLSSIADESLLAANEALEQALGLRPRDPRLLERRQAVLEAAGRWREAVDTKVALSETIESPRERARALAAAAGMCARRTRDVARAVALYEAAIADDPTTPGAFEAIEGVLVDSADWAGVERAYARQLERLSGRKEADAEATLLDKLAHLRRERLNDLAGAAEALDRLVRTKPDDVAARARLSALLEETGEPELAARCLVVAAAIAPARPATFRELHRIWARSGELDRDYCACAVLVHLGEADEAEQAVYRAHAPETTPKPGSALDEDGWAALAPAGHDHAVSRLVEAVAPAAIELRLEQLRSAGRLPELRRGDRQDPEKSTLTAVRTAAWSCAALGIEVPELYTRNEELPGGVVSMPVAEPAFVLGKSLLSGRQVPELVFATARELASQKLSARLLTFYPSLADLRTLLLVAVAQVMPMSLAREALPLRDALAQRIQGPRRSAVEQAVGALHSGDGRLDLNRWLRGVELASCRAGLLACGDITAAARMLAVDGRVVGKLSAADRVRDLVPFSVSEEHARLRRSIGIAVASARGPVHA